MKILLLALMIFVHVSLFNENNACAYLDPATGSVVLGLISAVGSALFIFYEKLVRFVLAYGRPKRKAGTRSSLSTGGSSAGDLLIHCESPTYLPLFEPLLRGLKSEGLECQVIFSSDREREVFQKHANAKMVQVPTEKIFSKIMASSAPVFVSTTPGLDVLGLRRSARFKKSCHVVHSPADIHTYGLFSFDRYDAVLCAGEFQVRSLRRLERLRGNGLKNGKLLPITGVLYYDEFLREKESARVISECLLIAPTWGKSSLLYQLNFDLLAALAQQYKSLSIRFHPQSRKADAQMVEVVLGWVKRLPNVRIDQSPSSYLAIQSAMAMLSDISAVMIDFKILKPEGQLYFFPSCFHFGDKEGHWLKWQPYELTFARKYGIEVRELKMLHELKSHRNENEITDYGVAHLGTAGAVSARFLKGLVQEC